jgi:hypothetical protein
MQHVTSYLWTTLKVTKRGPERKYIRQLNRFRLWQVEYWLVRNGYDLTYRDGSKPG